MNAGRRVVITGIGAVSCLGNSVQELWNAVINGKCGLGKVERFDLSAYRTQIAGEVKNFDPTIYMTEKEARRLDDFALYAIAASDEAMKMPACRWICATEPLSIRTASVSASAAVSAA